MEARNLKGRIAAIGLGHTADILMTKGYTWLVVTNLMAWFHPVTAVAINLVCSFLLCLLTLKFYDWAKRDWLGLETLKEVRETRYENILARSFSWVLRRGDWVGMIALAFVKDAFYCTAWMRKGAHRYNGMNRRDWGVFITALLISTLWESFYVYLIVTFGKSTWRQLFG